MPPQPALRYGALDAGAVFGRRPACCEEGVIDQLDVQPAVLHRLGGIGDLDELARGGVGTRKGRSATNFTASISRGRRSGVGTMPRHQHPLPFGRDEVLALPHEALLMGLEVGDALPDLLALGRHPIHGRHPVRFDDGARHRWCDMNAFRKRHRFVDQRIEIISPIFHFYFPRAPVYRP